MLNVFQQSDNKTKSKNAVHLKTSINLANKLIK